MPVQHETHAYWVGNLAVTMAAATTMPDPKPLLRSALKDFLADQPAGSPLKQMVREQMGKRR